MLQKIYCSIFFFFLLVFSNIALSQVVINEICPANFTTISDESYKYHDWIELYNSGSTTVNLQGYGLSDDPSKPFAFTFPNQSINPGAYVLVFASDKNKTQLVNHYETAAYSNDQWRYFVGTSQPDTNWRNLSFNDSGWLQGRGGFGFGDNDDSTTFPICWSVFVRKQFSIPDTSNILKAILNMDYDDGFAAFLNGVEIARANLGVPGDRPAYNQPALTSHEAKMYLGQAPDSFYIDDALLKSVIRPGTNVLAIQVHNLTQTSNDLSCIPFLTFGVKSSSMTYGPVPAWFRLPPAEHYQAKFKLSKNGETVYLRNPSGTIADQRTFTAIENDHSAGLNPDGTGLWCAFNTPTPLQSNNGSTCYFGYASIPLFSLNAGFYPSTQWLTLNTAQSGATIRYSLDGSDVTLSSAIYSAPLLLSNNTLVRARVYATGYLPSTTVTNSYFINESIHYPVFTITTDPVNLWDYYSGIYVYGPNADSINYPYFGSNFWQDWEKPATIEYYDKQKNRLLRFNADIKIYGNYSRGLPQKSFEIKLSDRMGTGSVEQAFYSRKPYLRKSENIVLRNAGSDNNWLHFRDHLMEQNLQSTHSDFIAQDEVVLYLNGQFWGIYQVCENEDFHYIKNNFGYDKDEIDLLREKQFIEVRNGSDTGFYNMLNYALATPANDPNYYTTMNGKFDLLNLADYFIAETYYCNEDWLGPWTNNIKLWRSQKPGGRWKYITYDLDFGLAFSSLASDNMLGVARNPADPSDNSDLFDAMLNNNQFRRYFINRYADLINTIFLPSNMASQLTAIRDTMALDISKQFVKWGLTQLRWDTERNKALLFISQRPAYARNYVQSEFGMTSQVTLTLNVQPAGAGRIQISTVTPGTYPWSGVYYNGNPVTITAIPNPGYTFQYWHSNFVILANDSNQSTTYNFSSTDQITAYFSGSPVTPLLTINEINYNSNNALDAGDWMELHNYGSSPVDISGWMFRDEEDMRQFIFPVNTEIPAGGYLVVAENLAKFSSIHPAVTNAVGPLSFGFDNGGELLRLFDYRDTLYKYVYYFDQAPWPVEADGMGYTCELNSPALDLNDGNNWSPGCLGGSPGRMNGAHAATITASGNITFCTGDSVVLSANTATGYSYQWLRNNTPIPGALFPTLTVSDSGEYRVSVTYQGCTSISGALLVTVYSIAPDPVVNFAYRCGPGTVTLQANSAFPLSWFDSPGGNLIGSGSTYTTPSISSITNYYVQAGGQCPGNFVMATANVYAVSQSPVATGQSRCGPGTVVLTATAIDSIYWYANAAGGSPIASGGSFTTPFLNQTTTYYVGAGTFCPSPRIAVNATINALPAPTVTDGQRCGSGTVQLSASSSFPILWFTAMTGGVQVGSGSTFTTPVITATTVYYAEANNGSCPSPRTAATATINNYSQPPTVFSNFICGPGSIALSAIASDPISWYDAPLGGNLLGTGSSLLLSSITGTTVVYAVAGTLCPSSPVADTAYVYPIPTVNLGNDTIIFSPQSIVLDAGAGFSQYLWSTGATTQTIVVSATNFYWVTVTDANQCANTDTIMVTVLVDVAEQLPVNFELFPNPANDVVSLILPQGYSSEDLIISLLDVTGRIVHNEFSKEREIIRFSVRDLARGTYLLKVQSGAETKVRLLVLN